LAKKAAPIYVLRRDPRELDIEFYTLYDSKFLLSKCIVLWQVAHDVDAFRRTGY